MCLVLVSEQTAVVSRYLIGFMTDGVFTTQYELNLYMQFRIVSLKRLERSVCLE
jgi:hypothetical protein